MGRTGADKRRRLMVEASDDVDREIRRLAILNDLKIYEFTYAVVEEFLRDRERVKALVRRLKLQRGMFLKLKCVFHF